MSRITRQIWLRVWQLNRTAQQIYHEQGLLAVIKRTVLWINGERGYYRKLNPLFPSYAHYCYRTEPTIFELIQQQLTSQGWHSRTHFAVLTFIHDNAIDLHKTAHSLKNQSYTEWVWFIVANQEQQKCLSLAQISKWANLIDAEQISASVAEFDYVAILDAGDQLALNALYAIADTVYNQPEAAYIYSDIDSIDEKGQRSNPFFKPDWSPEMMLSVNLLHPFGVCRLDVWDALAPFTNAWDFGLRLTEYTQNIVHIPQILYHRNIKAKEVPDKLALTSIKTHLERGGLLNPVVTFDNYQAVRVQWELPFERRISIIIPSRDNALLIEKCLSSLFTLTTYHNYQVILVDNGSVEPETLDVYAQYQDDPRFQVVYFKEEFNFSRACNFGASLADGDLLLFLNNDTEVLHADWLHLMAQWFERPGVGIIGCKLLYSGGEVQHAGIILGIHGLVDNLFALADEHTFTPYGTDDWVRNFLAVTAACLMISREAFDSVGGYDETYILVFSDVDLCLRVHNLGYRVVYTPHVRLLHHEASTHKRRIPTEDMLLANQRFWQWIKHGDPYYNVNLTTRWQIPDLQQDEYDTPYQNNTVSMKPYLR
jgi:GT2 family glycosyltransferase